MKKPWWIITIGFILLGIMGYAEGILLFQWSSMSLSILLVLFITLSVGQIFLTLHGKNKSAEEFYDEEIIEVYLKDSSQDNWSKRSWRA